MRISDEQRRLSKASYDLAMGYGHDYLGTEHELLALVSGESDLVRALRSLELSVEDVRNLVLEVSFADATFIEPRETLSEIGVDLDELSDAADKRFGGGAVTLERAVSSTPQLSQIHAIAPVEAERLGHPQVRSGHIGLALLRHDERTRVVFDRAGVDFSVLRRALMGVMDVPQDVIDRYERERAAAQDAARSRGESMAERFFAAVPAEGQMESAIDELFRRHTRLALTQPHAAQQVRARAEAAGFVVFDAAHPKAAAVWIVSEPELKQLIMMSVGKLDDGGWYAGVDDLGKLPHWLKDDDWPQQV